MKKKRLHINRILTLAMLWVFSIAITPWSIFHHHPEVHNDAFEKTCTHKFHVKATQDHCLICSAHFEKDYTASNISYVTYLNSKSITKNNPVVTCSYTELISTSLRGPPSAVFS